jgi:outer membrane protein insertion porin family
MKDELFQSISLKEGDIFNRNLIIKDIQTLTDMFADKGYAYVDINPVTSDFLDSINIDFKISTNKKVFINRITISGNTRTQDEVIRREIGIAEGGQYSRSVLRDSILN